MSQKLTGRVLAKLLLVLTVLSTNIPLIAQQERVVTFDPANTTVSFTLGDVLHTVRGTFKLKSGSIRFAPETGAASGALVVDATSGDTGNQSRDKKMHREILESDKYPEIVFTAQKVSGSIPAEGTSQVNVQGMFRLHGSDHPLILTVPIAIHGNEVTANTQFDVPYQSWGLKNPSTFILRVSNKVRIVIAANGRIN